MELSRNNRGQWGLLLLVIVGVFLYRAYSQVGDQAPDPKVASAHQEEMAGMWFRIPSYPGSKAPEPLIEATPERIIWERLQPSPATYEQARDFYEKELPGVGWYKVGESKDIPGFGSPLFLFSNGTDHLILSKEAEGILLRMTWSWQPDVLYDARIKR